MRSHAKRPTAGPNRRRAKGPNRLFRGSFAGRGASAGAKGRGARSHRGRVGILTLAAAALASTIIVASALASKEIVDFFGTKGSLGGQINDTRGIDVNPTGVGPADPGDIYAAELGNDRIQRFDSEGNFVSAWGADVSLPDGGTDYEICTEASECQAAAASGGNGTTAGNGVLNNPVSVAVDGDTGDVYVVDRDNGRINQYDGVGNFIRSFGWSVNATVAGTAYEICPATDVCKAGTKSSNPGVGQLHTDIVFDMYGFAASPPDGNPATGKLFLANSGARRIETYNLDGTSPANFGTSAVFADDQPRKVAVDSRGIVYASDSQNNGEIERYDAEDANGGGIGFLAPITAQNSTPSGPLLPGGGSVAERNTADLAVDPDTDGAGPDEDVLYVLRAPASGSVAVQQIGPGSAPGLTTPPNAVDDVHGEGAGLPPGGPGTRAIAVDAESERIYVFADGTVPPIGADDRIFVLGDDPGLPDPTAMMGATTEVTEDSATFNATVDPMGGLGVTCHYEYSTDPGFAGAVEVPESDCPSLDPEGGPQSVSEEVSGLDPNEHYFVRIVVTRFFAPASSAIASGLTSFDTDAPPPVITDVGAIQVQDTSARLVGTIDPRNNPTGYVFEYGTTPALGSTTKPVDIGGGTTPITVSQVVGGLTKNTTYYFRLLATNLTGSTASAPTKTFHTRATPFPPASPGNCPNEARRAEQGSTHLPDCRAYEMVSPPDKNQGSALTTEGGYPASFSRDGTGAFFCASTVFGEPAGQQTFVCSPYVSKRGPGGWHTSPAGPRYCNVFPDSRPGGVLSAFPSPESFDRLALIVPEADSCPFSPLAPGAPLPFNNLYLQDLSTDPAAIHLLTPEPRIGGEVSDPTGQFGIGSPDFSHVVYASKGNQTTDSPPQGDFMKLYDWEEQGHGDCSTPGGCLGLLSVDPAGNAFTTASKLPGHDINAGLHPNVHAISEDGERVYFQNRETSGTTSATQGCNTAACDLYLRENGTDTIHVSASECTSECGVDSSPDAFRLATPDGSKAIFVSCAKLTDASAPGTSGCNGAEHPTPIQQLKLYRWDRNAPPGSQLVDVSLDEEPADGTQPEAMDPIGMSDDGDTVFFIANGQIVAGEPTEPGLKLYRWRWNGGSPTVDYLAPYLTRWPNGTSSGSNGSTGVDPNLVRLHVRVTPDGEQLLIQTTLRYDPAADRDPDADLYRWDEQSGWRCVSCQLPGEPSAGHVNSFRGSTVQSITVSHEARVPEHTISDDGTRVFFQTPDALVPQDTNGETGCPVVDTTFDGVIYSCQDVYEWHDGTVSLITPGTGSEPIYLMGATASGAEVFFFTAEPLIGWDQDEGKDVYVARRGGGFPEPAPQPPECEGEGCREEGTEAPEIAGAGSAVFQGAGNPKLETSGNRCPANRLRRGKRCFSLRAIARKRCRRLSGTAKRRCIVKQTRRLRRAKRRANRRAQRRMNAHRANAYRRATR